MALAILATSSVVEQISKTASQREEYIRLEKDLKLKFSDLGDEKPIIIIHGWPLNDTMYEYQYQYQLFDDKSYGGVRIMLLGFGKSDKPYDAYNYNVYG